MEFLSRLYSRTDSPRFSPSGSVPTTGVPLGPGRPASRTWATATAKPTQFPIFMQLPAELRAYVWRHTFEPRILRINLYTRNNTTDEAVDRQCILPVVTPSRELARVTRPRRQLLQVCTEARAELLRFLPDCLPLEYLKDRRTVCIPYHRHLDLICYQHVSPIVFTHVAFTKSPELPPMSFPVQSIAFDEDFIDRHLDSAAPIHSAYQNIGNLLEMMPTVRRIYVVDTDVEIERAAYPFRIMAGKHNKWICLHHEPRSNPNVLYPRDFERTVEIGQELCETIRQHHWQDTKMAEQEISVFVLSPSSSRIGFWAK